MSAAQVVLAALEAAGEAVSIVCPGCKAAVDLGEALAATLLTPSTEAQQVATAEEAILDADAAAVAALKAAHVNLTPSPTVSAVAAVAAAALAPPAVAPTPPTASPAAAVAAHVADPAPTPQPAGTVKSWQ